MATYFKLTYPEVKAFPNGWYGSPAGSPRINPLLIDEENRVQIGYTLDTKDLPKNFTTLDMQTALEEIDKYPVSERVYTGERLEQRNYTLAEEERI